MYVCHTYTIPIHTTTIKLYIDSKQEECIWFARVCSWKNQHQQSNIRWCMVYICASHCVFCLLSLSLSLWHHSGEKRMFDIYIHKYGITVCGFLGADYGISMVHSFYGLLFRLAALRWLADWLLHWHEYQCISMYLRARLQYTMRITLSLPRSLSLSFVLHSIVHTYILCFHLSHLLVQWTLNWNELKRTKKK